MEIEESKLNELLTQNEEYKKDVSDLLLVAEGIIGVLGLTDEVTGKIKPEYFDGTDSPMPAILKGVSRTMMLMTQAGMPVIGKNAEKELAQKFDFIKYLLPILEKYK